MVMDIESHAGNAYRGARRLTKAEEILQKALKNHPYNSLALYELAQTYWEMNKKDKTVEHLKKALFVWQEADSTYKYAQRARDKLMEWTK